MTVCHRPPAQPDQKLNPVCCVAIDGYPDNSDSDPEGLNIVGQAHAVAAYATNAHGTPLPIALTETVTSTACRPLSSLCLHTDTVPPTPRCAHRTGACTT